MEVEIEDGKYTYQFHPDGRSEVLRHGEPWRDTVGDKFIYCMASEIERLRQRVAELERFHELDTKQIAYLFEERDALKQQRDELVAAAEAIEIDAEECLDFDDCSAMLVSIDAYHKLIEAIASINEK